MALFSPWGNQQFFDDNGNPATGWKIYTYAAGSSTPLATYTTEAGTVAQSNPIILNSLGFVSNPIFLTAGLAYKLVLTNASDVVKGPPVDGITGVTGTASTSQWQASGLTPTYVSATSFTLAGDQTTNFHVKRRIQSTNTAGTITSTITATAYTTLTTVTVVNDSGALDSGLSAVNLGLLTANNPSVPTSYAKSGANSDITSLSALTSINGGSIGGTRNKLINGSFRIDQRDYVSGAATTAGQYTLDRWKVSGTAGITFSTTNNVTTVTIPSGQTLQQVIEGINLQSGTHVLSWAGTAQGRIDGGSYGASGAVTATAVGGTNMTVEFNTGTLSQVQLEEGSLASLFEQRQYGLELVLCQRYYYQNSFPLDFSVPTNLTSAVTSGFRPVLTHPVTMRANPTVTVTAQTQVDRANSPLTSNTATATHLNLRGDIAAGSGVALWTNVSFNCAAEL